MSEVQILNIFERNDLFGLFSTHYERIHKHIPCMLQFPLHRILKRNEDLQHTIYNVFLNCSSQKKYIVQAINTLYLLMNTEHLYCYKY